MPNCFSDADADATPTPTRRRRRRWLRRPAVCRAGRYWAGPASKRRKRAKKLAGSPMRVMVRVDLDALLRGVALDGELCEIAGYGPVPVSVIEDLLATENPFIVGILTKPRSWSRLPTRPSPDAYQRSALDFLYPTCAAEGCSSRQGLQYDHRLDYAKTHFTAFDLLDRLCRHHHDQKTRHGWALVDGKGKTGLRPTPRPPPPTIHPPRPPTTRPPPEPTTLPSTNPPTTKEPRCLTSPPPSSRESEGLNEFVS